ncbi:MAG: hypothetical protein RL757_185 [Bacteroidota bacterium]|jgi:heme/copper-type cytochrome/quinol oxidase subunit 2
MTKKKPTAAPAKRNTGIEKAKQEAADAQESKTFLTVLFISVILLVVVMYFLMNR